MTDDMLFTLVAMMLALPVLVVIALAVIVVWNLLNPWRRF
jgi:hypothetical protein